MNNKEEHTSLTDGFKVEEIVRSCIGLRENDETPEDITFGYNDLIYYTQFIIESILAESINQTNKIVKENTTRSLN